MNTPIRHGKILLVPISASELPSSKSSKTKKHIVGHSETGHHHVLEADTSFEVFTEEDQLFLSMLESGTLVHQKSNDRHIDLEVPAGAWKVVTKTEFNPYSGFTQTVRD